MGKRTLEEAVKCIIENCRPVAETIVLPLMEADGYVLSEDVRAAFDQPPFARSPLDGYALFSADTKGASEETPVKLRVIDTIMAGFVSDKQVVSGTAVRLMTGAPIPAGADCVIRQENTDYGTETVEIYEELSHHDNICAAGEDFAAGTILAEKGSVLHYTEIAVLASAGITEVSVYRKLRAALFTSGDELQEPGAPLRPGKIYNSNIALASLRLKEWGAELIACAHIEDDPQCMRAAIEAVADTADIILTTGGVSVGQKDIMHETVALLKAEKLFWGVSIKPGAPTIACVYRDKPLICLTGNPYGVLVNLELLAGQVISYMSHNPDIRPPKAPAVSACDYKKTGGVRRIVRAVCREGMVWIPEGGQMSGVIGSMHGCNCLVDIAPDCTGIQRGDQLQIWYLN